MKERFFRAAALVCCLAAASCGTAPTQQAASEYAVLTVTPADREVANPYSAAIRGRRDIAIYPQVSGTISQLCVNEGEIVRLGQTLFVIDQVPYKAALQTAQANVAAAQAGESTSQLIYDSKKELFAKNVISEFDLQTAKNALLTAQAQVAQAKAQEVGARNNLSYTVVKSPLNGVVGILPYNVGALVSPSLPKPLTTVSDNAEVFVYFSMNETQLLNLTREFGSTEKALKSLPDISLKLSDGTIYDATGRIASISGVIDSSTGSVSLRAEFPNKGHLLHSGSSGNVIIPQTMHNCIVVPQSATFELQNKTYVYKIAEGKAQSALVTVIPLNGGREFVVTSGLASGDTIIAEGVGLIREGMPVTAKADTATAAPAAKAEVKADSTATPAAQTTNSKKEE
ncbi:MAG: efflux RND transporter periplasmic adaptor subunit [Alistipes sp.]